MTSEDIDARLLTIKDAVRHYLDGIDRTARVFPFGALHLGASLIDVLARLTSEKKGGGRGMYERFVKDYLPPEYSASDLPWHLYQGLRNCGLHNLSVGPRLALMDGQLHLSTHLKVDDQGRTIIRMEEFVQDLRVAITSWERSLQRDKKLRSRVVEREQGQPVFEVLMINVPSVPPGLVEITSPSPVSSTFAASAAVYPAAQPRRP